MRGHAERDGEHEDAVHNERIEDVHRGNVVYAVGGKEEKAPAAANRDAAKELVAFALFDKNSAAEEHGSDGEDNERFSAGAEVLRHEHAEQRDADYGHENAELGEPVGAERFFDSGKSFDALFASGFRRGCAQR